MNEWNLEQGYPEIAMGIGIPIRKEFRMISCSMTSSASGKSTCRVTIENLNLGTVLLFLSPCLPKSSASLYICAGRRFY